MSLVNVNRRSFIRRVAGTAGAWSVLGLPTSIAAQGTIESDGARTAGTRAFVPMPGYAAAISGPGTNSPNTLWGVMYRTEAGPGSRNGNGYFANWCSGVYAPDDGPLGSMVFCNGGDADYWGNEVYRFALDTRTWSRISERSIGLNGKTSNADDDPNFDMQWGEHISPGGKPPPQPGVPHSYDQMEYLPPALGGGPRGSFMFATRTIVYRYRGFRHPHLFDLDRKSWRRGSAQPDNIRIGRVDAPSWCFDSSRGRYWGIEGGASGIYVNHIHYLVFDRQSGLADAGVVSIPRFLTPWGCPVSRYWRRGDLLLLAGRAADGKSFGLWTCPLVDGGNTAFTALQLAGSSMPPPGDGYGFVYCNDLDCFFVRAAAGERQKLWKVIPPKSAYLASPWQVEEVIMQGATIAPRGNGQGMWKRLMYAPRVKCLLWVDDEHGAVYAYRPLGT